MENFINKLVTCPYDDAHKVKESRLQMHIAKCKRNHLDLVMESCPFNASHIFPPSEKDYHVVHCVDRKPFDRKMALESLEKNNPNKGRTAVPSYNIGKIINSDECWDDDISSPGPGYVPKPPPADAILEPPAMSKPSERRRFYQELHMRDKNGALETKTSPPANTTPTPRQPKQPSETQKLQSMQQMQLSLSPNLGLGRGKPVAANRIAASIFPQTNEDAENTSVKYSSIVNSMAQLGLGRGQSSNEPIIFDNEDFPVLGRGIVRTSRQNVPRVPGSK